MRDFSGLALSCAKYRLVGAARNFEDPAKALDSGHARIAGKVLMK